MEKIDYSKERAAVLLELSNAKNNLISSREEIRKASLNSKEIISFLRGSLANFKK